MKIKLLSDFMDIYDHWFCGSYEKHDILFDRRTNIGMNRSEMFNFFRENDISCPMTGYINSNSFSNLRLCNWDAVVYLDQNSHRGENKIKLSFNEAFEEYKGYFCSHYIEPHEESDLGYIFRSKSTSYRRLFIGRYEFKLKYKSDHDWLSNNGNVDISIENFLFNETYSEIHKKVNNPIFSIDYVKDELGMEFAIDLNISPGLKGIGIEQYLSPKEIYKGIECWYENE